MKTKLLLAFLAFVLSFSAARAEVYSGFCGTNVTWTLDTSTGLLKIEGSGAMKDYDYHPTPSTHWRSYESSIKKVEIADGVTSIGNYAFGFCSSLASITIPGSVTSIGNNAFVGCSSLASVTIPNSVTSIGNNAFYECFGLTSITIPNSVTRIGDYAFYKCSGLTSVTIPGSVTSIGSSAFSGCFGLTSITIPNSVTRIGDYAFNGCSGLTSITIPESMTSIGENTFAGIAVDEVILNSQSIAGKYYNSSQNLFKLFGNISSLVFGDNITTIGDNAFYSPDNMHLNSVTFGKSVKSIGEAAFYGCKKLETLNFKSETSLENIYEAAFYGCSSLHQFKVFKTIKKIEESAFEDCTNLQNLTFENGTKLRTIPYRVFYNCALKDLKLPEGIESIGSEAFSNNNISGTLWLPNSIEHLAKNWCDGQIHCKELVLLCSLSDIAYNSDWGISGTRFYADDISLWTSDMHNWTYLPSGERHPIDSLDYTATPTSIVTRGIYSNNKRIGIKSIELTETIDRHHIARKDAWDTYKAPFKIKFEDGREVNHYKEVGMPFVVMNTLSPVVTSSSKAILISETNITELENNIGFEVRKYGAPDNLEPKRIPGFLYNGLIEGCIENLAPTYYEVRSFYQPENGEIIYGKWVSFDAADFSHSEPVVHTYDNANVQGTSVLLKGVAIEGTDVVLKEGFEYWTATSKKYTVELDFTQSGIFSAQLQQLQPNTQYNYRAYAITNNGNIYGETMNFSTGDSAGTDSGNDSSEGDSEIIVTDVTTYPNIIYTDNQTQKAGKSFILPIKMKNSKEEIVGFQCDLVLPNCVSLEKNSRGSIKAPTFNEEAGRTSSEYHVISAAAQQDGSVRILCFSNENELILGTDGVVCDFNASMAKDVDSGDYAIVLKNITMTTSNATKYTVPKATFKITVPSYTEADANGDGEIDVADISITANEILGNHSENFVMEAADIDKDNVLDVADIAGIANIILYGESGSNKVRGKLAPANVEEVLFLGVESFSVKSGTKKTTPTLNLTNPGYEFCGFQCDIYFPEGISWEKNSRGKLSAPKFNEESDRTSSEYHTVSAATQTDGAVRILCYSTENEIFLGEEGAILDLPIILEDGLAEGVYEVTIKNIVLSRPNQPKVSLEENKFQITIVSETGIDEVIDSSVIESIYSVDGMKQTTLKKGINIVRDANGTKMILMK